MKIHRNGLVADIDSLSSALSLFNSSTKAIKWEMIPNAQLEIIKERIKGVSALLDELFDLTDNYYDPF